jgi:hypothetical protein
MNYSNRGGTAATDESTLGLGTFSWSQLPGCVQLGTFETEVEALLLYPNPAINQVTIQNPVVEGLLAIYDSNGKWVNEYLLSTEKNTIDISALSKGLYLLVLKNQKTLRTSKLIKQ